MSLGISALGWVAIGVGTYAAASSADSSRKALHAQSDAINASKVEDATQKAQAEAGANAALVADKKRRRASAGLLASSDPAASQMSTSVLGGAAMSDGRATIPRTTLGGP